MKINNSKKIVLSILVTALVLPCLSSGKLSIEKINYIKSKYEHKMFGKECLFYPAQKAKRLLILFNGATKNRYMMLTWFWRDNEKWEDTAYLFLKDDDFCWYIGNDEKSTIPDYTNIINHFIAECKIKNDQVFTIGGSMGGYGAVLYATMLELKGAIVVNPQVDKASNDVRFLIGNTQSRWQDLDKVIASYQTIPMISLIFANRPDDQAASYTLIEELKKKTTLLIIRRFLSKQHAIAGTVLSTSFIDSEIAYMEQQAYAAKTKSILVEDEKVAFF
jgi:hypothetical protein